MSDDLFPSRSDDRPFGATTDDAVSASLDGELAGFARDAGLTEEDAAERLARWPAFDRERATLAAARRAAATPPAPLDELTRRRLVGSAMAAVKADAVTTTPPQQARRAVWARVGAVAAALALVIGGASVATQVLDGDDDRAPDSVAGSAAQESGEISDATAVRRGDLGNLGDVSDQTALREALTRTGTEPDPGPDARTAAPSESFASDGSGAGGGERCVADAAAGRAEVLRARGTVDGVAVVILGVEDAGRVVVFTIRADTCEIVGAQSL